MQLKLVYIIKYSYILKNRNEGFNFNYIKEEISEFYKFLVLYYVPSDEV